MSKITWDSIGERYYETGVDHGVFYPLKNSKYGPGVAWNGLTNVTESPEGAEANDLYADNIKYASLRSAETFGATIEAYTYPDEFGEADGSIEVVEGVKIGQQNRKTFGLSYRTMVGNDEDGGSASDYKLHLIYGATASPSEKGYSTINDSPEAITFSWDLTTTPVPVTGYKPTASIVIDSRTIDKDKLAALEAKLYGSESSEPELPLPDDVIALLKGED